MNVQYWIKASRLPAQAFIFPGLLLGQGMAFYNGFTWSWIMFGFLFFYGISMHLFIVYSNDYADFETDQINKSFTPFTGGSRVLIDGDLSKKQLGIASIVTLFTTILIAIMMSFLQASFWPLLLAFIGVLLMQAYSFKPIKLSYRGYGEVLQMLGVGLVLPLISYFGQAGNFTSFPLLLMLILLPSQFAMALGTSLPDEPSDRLSEKNTTVVNLGVTRSKYLMICLYLVSLLGVMLIRDFDFSMIVILSLMILIMIQGVLAIKRETLPGTKAMFYLVALSILTNTSLVIAISLQLIY